MNTWRCDFQLFPKLFFCVLINHLKCSLSNPQFFNNNLLQLSNLQVLTRFRVHHQSKTLSLPLLKWTLEWRATRIQTTHAKVDWCVRFSMLLCSLVRRSSSALGVWRACCTWRAQYSKVWLDWLSSFTYASIVLPLNLSTFSFLQVTTVRPPRLP